MKTFSEFSKPEVKVEEEVKSFPTFSDIRSSMHKVSLKEEEVTRAAKKLEELKAELSKLQ